MQAQAIQRKKTIQTEEQKVAIPTEENDILDEAAKKLHINNCEFAGFDPLIKEIEFDYFQNFEVESFALFGGTLHHPKGV